MFFQYMQCRSTRLLEKAKKKQLQHIGLALKYELVMTNNWDLLNPVTVGLLSDNVDLEQLIEHLTMLI